MAGKFETTRELLRFVTVGSVDDGKSTLIGRLLYETGGVYDDQLESVQRASRKRSGNGAVDLSLVTDGLRAEREQGITIDVAYRYFGTPRREFILADSPGHEQYTRNMATAASGADLAVILLDAQNGVTAQSRRHAFIVSLLGIRDVVIAVNKMDVAGFAREPFERIVAAFQPVLAGLPFRATHFIPVSALHGDNVAALSSRTPWYSGPSVLEYLESAEPDARTGAAPLRFPIQYVVFAHGFRGYSGQVASGEIRAGDTVVALPSGFTSRVASVHEGSKELERGAARSCPTIRLERHLDLSRGDMLVSADAAPCISRHFSATVIWMSSSPLQPGATLLLKHTTRQVRAAVRSVRNAIDMDTLVAVPKNELALNDIGEVEFDAYQPLYFDPYEKNRTTGSFILIDLLSNRTVAAGMIRGEIAAAGAATLPSSVITPAHAGLTVWFTGLCGAGKTTICEAVRDRLAAAGHRVEVLDGDEVRKQLSKGLGFSREDRDENIRRIGFVARLLTRNGVIVLVAAVSPYRGIRDEVHRTIDRFLEVYVNAPLEVCEQRDPKGLYAKARAGQLPGFTGIDDPYEAPTDPAVECRTDHETIDESVVKVMDTIDAALRS